MAATSRTNRWVPRTGEPAGDRPAAACRFCGGESSGVFVVGDRNRALGPGRFIYRRCRACDAIFIPDPPEDLGRYYATDGYGRIDHPPSPEIRRREQHKLGLLTRFAAPGRLIEIGPGPGYFARAAADAGFAVAAIEMDAGYADALRAAGIETVRTGAPQDVLARLGPAEAIVLWHVLEHLPDPAAVLAACAAALGPGGVLVVATPNPQSLQFRLLGPRWMHLDAPRHLQLLPARAVRERLERLGLAHRMTTTADAVGRELNRMGWESALRRYPARRRSSRYTLGGSAVVSGLLRGVEGRALGGAAYTSVFERGRA